MGIASLHPSALLLRGEGAAFSTVIARESGRSSIPETLVMGSIGRGVLDTRFRGYDGGGWDARFCLVIARSEATKQSILSLSFRGDAKHRTRNLEIPGLVLRTIPE